MRFNVRHWAVASRAIAAFLGGYVLSNALPAALVGVFPMGRAESAMTAMLASFAFYTLTVLWVFAARSAWRAWAGLLIALVLSGLLLIMRRLWS